VSNAIGWGVGAVSALTGFTVLVAAAVPERVRSSIVGLLTAAIGVLGLATGVAAMAGGRFAATLPDILPLAGVHLAVDALAGFFMAVCGGVVALAAGYGVGYAGHGHGPRRRGILAVLPVFAWSLLLVPCAASVSTFLVLWELVAVTSLLLVLAEHRQRPAVADGGWWYAVMTQLGFIAILLGFVTYAAAAGGETFAALRSADLSPALSGLVFVLLFAGLGAKAGLVPLHVWLPRAHPEAPAPVSAMLSGAMVTLGVYGVIRVGFDLLGGGPVWWWLLVLTAGAVTAAFGILQAVVATDVKRLLAYSTVENMGLVFIGLGAAGVLRGFGAATLASLAMAAALLQVVNHAAFKTLLFGAAGSVVRATGTRDLDALGGLRARLPATTVLFAIGALGASALPLGNGFVSEWLLLQSLVHAVPAGGATTAVAMPLAVAVVALTAGLSVATFVKALGVGFFARARGEVRTVAESPVMVVALSLAAVVCLALALGAGRLGPTLSTVVSTATGVPAEVVSGDVTLRLAGIGSTVSPLLIAAGLLGAAAGAAGLARLVRFGVRRRTAAALWDCGAGPPTARMQYTATSFAEPLQRVFDDVLAPQIDVNVTPDAESRYLVERVAYQRRIPDRVEHRVYQPAIRAVRRLGRLGPVIANGSVHRYLGYGFLGVTSLLLVLAVFW
jgi:formate hydrogenlyase subunit 3/multisubunit Na+/H+ antiporter MnhD subunit